MFSVQCDRHDSGLVLLDIDRITAIRTTRHGVEVDWVCWCGNQGTWRPHRDDPHEPLAAA